MFKITRVSRVSPDSVKVSVRIDGKYWAKVKASGGLGTLYGIDISNAAYRMHGVRASNPSVSDTERASGGIKWVDLYYADTAWCPAKDNVVQAASRFTERGLLHAISGAHAEMADNVVCVDFIAKRRVA